MTRKEWEAEVIRIEPRCQKSIECSAMDEDYDAGMTPDEAVCEWRRRHATGKADRANGC